MRGITWNERYLPEIKSGPLNNYFYAPYIYTRLSIVSYPLHTFPESCLSNISIRHKVYQQYSIEITICTK